MTEVGDVELFLAPLRAREVRCRATTIGDEVLERWRLRLVEADPDVDFVGPRGEAAPDADSAVVIGPPTPRAFAHSVRYRSRQRRDGTVVTHRVTGLGHLPPAPFPRTRRRATIVVGNRTGRGLEPAVVQAGVPGGIAARLISSPWPRRRVVFEVASSPWRLPEFVVKAAVGAHAEGRFEHEQMMLEHLHEVGMDRSVPRGHGTGELEGVRYSVESRFPGRVMTDARPRWWRRSGAGVCTDVAAWFEELATSSVSPPARLPLSDRGLRTAGEATNWLAPLRPVLEQTPGVITHGDAANGTNILVSRGRFAVIDWETGATRGVPLVDLLPFACWAAARRRSLSTAEDRASFILALARGEVAESADLRRLLEGYATRLGLTTEQIGPLAAAAWAHHGSMRLRHQASVQESESSFVAPPAWSELVLRGWMEDPTLGHSWPALSRCRS